MTTGRSVAGLALALMTAMPSLPAPSHIARSRLAPSHPVPSLLAPSPFGPNVIVFDPAMPRAAIQATLDSVYLRQERSEFGDGRVAILFKPGRYDVVARVGYYMEVAGLGRSPDDVSIHGAVSADARWRNGNATGNFWRMAENLSVTPVGVPGVAPVGGSAVPSATPSTVTPANSPRPFDRWAVSQASPLRRVHIRGDLVLDDGGWSSGGFLADSKVDGEVRSGSQQQWLTRNSDLGRWTGSNWNMVFVGTRNAPAQSFPSPPYTTVESAPVIREKPFLYIDARGRWNVFVPALRSAARGTTWRTGRSRGRSYPLSDFYIARPGDSAARMNDALAHGRNLLFTPGIYHLDAPLHVARAHTVVLGLGLATLVADAGTTAIDVDDVAGVTLAGLLVEAGPVASPVLIQVGHQAPSGVARRSHASDPTLLADVFVRVGGAGVGRAVRSLVIASSDVIVDDVWLWRADHGHGVGWTSNTAANGLVVDGNDVTAYGLFVEHYQRRQVEWNGERGRTYFFQNEMPYDVPSPAEWMGGTTRGFAAYYVAPNVTRHEAWGLGSYCFFNRNPAVVADHAFEAPDAPGIRFRDMVTVSLGGGKGTIAHVIDDAGGAADARSTVERLVAFP